MAAETIRYMPNLPDPRRYSPGVAQAIVEALSLGTSLEDQHLSAPDRIPPPLFVRQWRREIPAFDTMMREAEAALAETLVFRTLKVARGDRLAAAAKNEITAMQYLAEKLDPARMASRQVLAGDASAPLRFGKARDELSDADLMAIAAGKAGALPDASQDDAGAAQAMIAAEPARGGGGEPRSATGTPAAYRVAGPGAPQNTSEDLSVTSVPDAAENSRKRAARDVADVADAWGVEGGEESGFGESAE